MGEAGSGVLVEDEGARAAFAPDETLFRALGESPTVAIFRADLDNHLLYVNERFCEIFRMSAQEVLAQDWIKQLHPEDLHQLESWAAPKPRSAFFRLLFPDGSVAYVSGQQTILYDEAGRPVGKVGTIVDITESEQGRRFDAMRNQLLEAVAKNEPTRVALRLLVKGLEEQCLSCSCVLLFTKYGRPFVTVGERVPQGLGKLIEQKLEALTPNWFTRPADVGLRMLHTADLKQGQDELGRLVEEAGLISLRELEVHSAGGLPIGWISLIAQQADVLTARHCEVLQEAARLATMAWENRQQYNKLQHRAQHDALTDLPNRLGLEAYVAELMQASSVRWSAALLCLDVDRFKQVNDLLGHSAADQLLLLIKRRLAGVLDPGDMLCRTGGDEFALLLPGVGTQDEASAMAQSVGLAMEEPFSFGNHEISATLSIGVSMFPDDGLDVDALLGAAEKAMFRVKSNGRDGYQVYQRDNDIGMSVMTVEGLLRKALKDGGFELLYQPQYTRSGRLAAFEALIRLRHDGQLWTPARFISVAEESGLIVPIGKWVLAEACRQAELWRQVLGHGVRMAVNVSALQFARADFPELVLRVLAETGLPAEMLELELTETVVMARIGETADQMRQLAGAGVRFAIDDFGTGFSSLHYLHRLPVQTLKIDRSFVSEMLEAGGTGPLVKGIISLAHSLQIEVVAEGVETVAQRAGLTELGCDLLQGYLHGEPLREAAATELLMRAE